MDYEKKYNEALKRAKAAIDIAADKDLVRGVATTIFPELRESEDERMIKAITHILYENYTDAAVIEGVEIAEIVTWLEKQKEQKQPEEICHKCIHHGKEDDYCYNPHGGLQSRINENGVYDCTGFCEIKQESLEEAADQI